MVRVRFAPSPTGSLHLGNARTALFNWLFARQAGGALLLRIEDTDPERTAPGAEAAILDELRWLGLDWDEGPDIGGPHAPYRQSERLDRYRAAAERLLENDRAYPCFCTPAELEARRRAQLERGEPPRYDGRCARLAPEAARARVRAGEGNALRLRVPPGPIRHVDLVKGAVGFEGKDLGDFLILRSDGTPAYNLAAVVDDAAMAISHVIRGEDHLPNTPRQLLLYRGLQLRPPEFAHLPLVHGPDGTPLAKRHGAVRVGEYREAGYLPEALVNYLALLGWSPSGAGELSSPAELARQFALERVSASPARFDPARLRWFNRQHLLRLPPGLLLERAASFLRAAGLDPAALDPRLPAALEAFREEAETLGDLGAAVAALLAWEASAEEALEAEAVLAGATAREALETVRTLLGEEGEQSVPEAHRLLREAQAKSGLRGRTLLRPVRAALTRRLRGPALPTVMAVLGREETLRRLSTVLGRSEGGAR